MQGSDDMERMTDLDLARAGYAIGPLELRATPAGIEVTVTDYHAIPTVVPMALLRALLDQAENAGSTAPGSQIAEDV